MAVAIFCREGAAERGHRRGRLHAETVVVDGLSHGEGLGQRHFDSLQLMLL